jgi:hypothetical protein
MIYLTIINATEWKLEGSDKMADMTTMTDAFR